MILPPQLHSLSLYFTLLLCSTAAPPFTAAQPASTTQEDDSIDSASMAILVLVAVSALLFLGSFSLWIQNCCNSDTPYSRSRSFRSVVFIGGGSRFTQRVHRQDSRNTASAGGVGKALLDSLPTMAYSAAKEMKIGAGSLECAVCLSEFSGEELLRLLPSCDHVFHPNCIAAWLANHATCPVCRSRVVDSGRNPIKTDGIPLAKVPMNHPDPDEMKMDIADSESVSEARGDSERFAMKLPEGVKEQMVKAGLKLERSASCECVPAEGISRWIGRSERWGSSVVPSDGVTGEGGGARDTSDLPPV